MKVLAVQNALCETLGRIGEKLLSDGFDVDSVNAFSRALPAEPAGYAGVIILGGPMAVYDGLAELEREQVLISSAISLGVPVLGICLGSQLIAKAAGGRVFKSPRKEIGPGKVELVKGGAAIFDGIPVDVPLKVMHWHGDTYNLPAGASVLARNELYTQAFQIGSAIGIQFHLEVDEPMVRRWVREYSGELENEGMGPDDVIPRPEDYEEMEKSCGKVTENFECLMEAAGSGLQDLRYINPTNRQNENNTRKEPKL